MPMMVLLQAAFISFSTLRSDGGAVRCINKHSCHFPTVGGTIQVLIVTNCSIPNS